MTFVTTCFQVAFTALLTLPEPAGGMFSTFHHGSWYKTQRRWEGGGGVHRGVSTVPTCFSVTWCSQTWKTCQQQLVCLFPTEVVGKELEALQEVGKTSPTGPGDSVAQRGLFQVPGGCTPPTHDLAVDAAAGLAGSPPLPGQRWQPLRLFQPLTALLLAPQGTRWDPGDITRLCV